MMLETLHPAGPGSPVQANADDIAHELLAALPLELSQRLGAVVFERDPSRVRVAILDPDDFLATDELTFAFAGTQVDFYAAPENFIRTALTRWSRYQASLAEGATVAELAPEDVTESLERGDEFNENGAMASLVGQLLEQAVSVNASDVHIEPNDADLVVRFRVDGVLRVHQRYPRTIANGLVNRIKVLSGIDLAERRKPQDGRFARTQGSKPIDCRVATIPTSWGPEGVVIRIFDQSRSARSLEDIGFHPHLVTAIKRVLRAPHGAILATGPTGSGKTTTLYAALSLVATADRKTVAVEDPVEIRFPAITQVQVNEKAELTFASALRSFLRADPDVMLVGEIRDLETAALAAQAAQTGHLVLSTLHTNDAASAPARLIDLGLPAYQVAGVVRAVLAQRLMRSVCPECSTQRTPSSEELSDCAWPMSWERPDVLTYASPAGCSRCDHTGYRGRLVVAELVEVSPAIAEAISNGVSAREVERMAHEAGTVSLHEDALAWVRSGDTTLSELTRVGL